MKRKRARSAPASGAVRRRAWLIAGVVLASLGAAATVLLLSTGRSGFGPATRGTAPVLPPPGPLVPADEGPPDPRAELPPIPVALEVLPRPTLVVQAVYEFAARHPDVLRYMPCFCGCEHIGHGSNHDCFVARRDRAGRVAWDAHGLSCGLCIDIARDAMRLHAGGTPLAEIRTEIERVYGRGRSNHTPTAPVP